MLLDCVDLAKDEERCERSTQIREERAEGLTNWSVERLAAQHEERAEGLTTPHNHAEAIPSSSTHEATEPTEDAHIEVLQEKFAGIIDEEPNALQALTVNLDVRTMVSPLL